MLYFAYGSNLNHFQMKKRCKDSKFIKKFILKNFKLTFRSFYRAADIEPKIKSLSNINLWANINPKGSYNNSHNHPGCDISGVYYVKVPKGKCGNIAFNDPRESYAYGNRFFVDRYTGHFLIRP